MDMSCALKQKFVFYSISGILSRAEFQIYRLKFHTQYVVDTLKDV